MEALKKLFLTTEGRKGAEISHAQCALPEPLYYRVCNQNNACFPSPNYEATSDAATGDYNTTLGLPTNRVA